MEMDKLQHERDNIKEQIDVLSSLKDKAKIAVLKSDEKCWNLQKEVENISEKIDLKNSDITRLDAEMSMKCEDLGAINSEMMTRYQIIEEMQNISIELNNDLEKVEEKIEIVYVGRFFRRKECT